MSVDKKAAWRKLLLLIQDENWQEDEAVVAEVQRLGKIASGRIRKARQKKTAQKENRRCFTRRQNFDARNS